MFNLGSIRPAHPRLAALTWGAEDIAAVVGATANKEPDGAMDAALPAVPLALPVCRWLNAEVTAIDTLYADFRDAGGAGSLDAASLAPRRFHAGRLAIHPDQVARHQPRLCAVEAEVAGAQDRGDAFDANPDLGTIGIDGKMYDIPHLKQARTRRWPRWEKTTGRIATPSFRNARKTLNSIREGVRAVVRKFDDDYWLARDEDGKFPREFHRAMAEAGWLGITMPEEYGGSGLGVTEAAIMMHEVASNGGGMAAASTVHINLFGPHPIVVFGTEEQKSRMDSAAGRGQDQVLLRLHRAGRGPQHHAHQDLRREGAGRLHGARPEGLDLDRAGGVERSCF
jgi:hypothetical protein